MTSQDADAPTAGRSRLVVALAAVCAIAALLIAGTVGWLVRGDGSDAAAAPAESSVDAGFARDMSDHHEQAVVMAAYVRDNTTNPSIKLLASDMAETQKGEIGRMSGWLDAWGLRRVSSLPRMSWMGGDHEHMDGNLMPGMATQGQLATLLKSHGTAMDVLFLQLMIHHHQGGIPMAQYAADHASLGYVRTAASGMVTQQTKEIIAMGQLLRDLGGTELPAPS